MYGVRHPLQFNNGNRWSNRNGRWLRSLAQSDNIPAKPQLRCGWLPQNEVGIEEKLDDDRLQKQTETLARIHWTDHRPRLTKKRFDHEVSM